MNVVMRLVAHLTGIALTLIDSKLNSKTIKVQAHENSSSIKTSITFKIYKLSKTKYPGQKKSSLMINIGKTTRIKTKPHM